MTTTIEEKYRTLIGRKEQARTRWDEVRIGQHVLWNYAGESQVIAIGNVTPTYRTLILKDAIQTFSKRLGKNTLMAIKEDQ